MPHLDGVAPHSHALQDACEGEPGEQSGVAALLHADGHAHPLRQFLMVCVARNQQGHLRTQG